MGASGDARSRSVPPPMDSQQGEPIHLPPESTHPPGRNDAHPIEAPLKSTHLLDDQPAIYHGGGTMLSLLDTEGSSVRMAKQQRKLQQMDERHKKRLSKNLGDGTNRRASPRENEA